MEQFIIFTKIFEEFEEWKEICLEEGKSAKDAHNFALETIKLHYPEEYENWVIYIKKVEECDE